MCKESTTAAERLSAETGRPVEDFTSDDEIPELDELEFVEQ